MTEPTRVVLVTGASRGIGRAMATAFAADGASVALHYHQNRAAAEEVLSHCGGGPHLLVQGDIAKPEEGISLINRTVAHFGRLDVLVNNAGIFEAHKILEVDFAAWQLSWQRTIETNLMGPANLCWGAANQMVKQGQGRIINITSRGAFRGEPDCPAYGASKAGLNSLSQSLAKALAPHGVFAYAIAPGWVATDMAAESLAGEAGAAILREIPLGRVAAPEEIAQTALFLASAGAASLTGAIVDVNGASYLRS